MSGQKQPNPPPEPVVPTAPPKKTFRRLTAKTFWVSAAGLTAVNFAFALLPDHTFVTAFERTYFQLAALLLVWLFSDKEVATSTKPERGLLQEMLQRCIDENDAAVARGLEVVKMIPLEQRRAMYREWFAEQGKQHNLSFAAIFRKRAELGLQDDDDLEKGL